jgi:hypothetical protein
MFIIPDFFSRVPLISLKIVDFQAQFCPIIVSFAQARTLKVASSKIGFLKS